MVVQSMVIQHRELELFAERFLRAVKVDEGDQSQIRF
jgi:hypothetical protein